MNTYAVLSWVHVLLFGFWLGSDFGTFASSRFLMDPDRDLPTRLAFAKAMMVFDLGPRVALIVILPVGLHLASLRWALDLPVAALVGIWIAAAAWLGLMLRLHLDEDAPGTAALRRLDTAVRVSLALGLVGLSVASLVGDEPFAIDWLAIKVGLFGLVVAAGIGIRVLLPAFSVALGAIVTEGSTPEREAALRRSLVRTYPFVGAIWVMVLTIGYLGVAKP